MKVEIFQQVLGDILARLKDSPDMPGLHRDAVEQFRDMYEADPAGTEYNLNIFQPQLYELLGILFSGDVVKHQYLGPVAAGQVRLKYPGLDNPEDSNWNSLLGNLAQDDLFLALLEKTYNADIHLEIFLTGLRRYLLFAYLDNAHLAERLQRLVIAMAQQCFNNEYLFDESESEVSAVAGLSDDLLAKTQAGQGPDEGLLMVVGMYQPLARQAGAVQIVDTPLDKFSEPAGKAFLRMVHEPHEEERIRNDLPSFGRIENQTSTAVRSHYEENPFPRWLNLGGSMANLDVGLREVRPGFVWPTSLRGKKRTILVAGCGTGQQPLGIARGNPDAEVVAVDLSRASLAYASRMADRYGLNNVTFMHGDILNLDALGVHFDHVECVGVLHCFENPYVGWQAIDRVLAPGGTLHIGVYSQVARLHIAWLKQQVEQLGLEPTARDMKRFRKIIVTEKKYKAVRKPLMKRDFFNLSMFRDLVFHEHEYRYVLSEIKSILDKLDLEFLGFNVHPGLEKKYRELYPDDPQLNSLENWRRFEVHYAGTSQMFRMWLQKTVR